LTSPVILIWMWFKSLVNACLTSAYKLYILMHSVCWSSGLCRLCESADRLTMDLKKIQDEDREGMFGSVFGVSGPGMHHSFVSHCYCLLLLMLLF